MLQFHLLPFSSYTDRVESKNLERLFYNNFSSLFFLSRIGKRVWAPLEIMSGVGGYFYIKCCEYRITDFESELLSSCFGTFFLKKKSEGICLHNFYLRILLLLLGVNTSHSDLSNSPCITCSTHFSIPKHKNIEPRTFDSLIENCIQESRAPLHSLGNLPAILAWILTT